jgi:Transposase DDE domain
MERELWPPLYRLIQEVARTFSQKYVQHQPWVLVAVMLWATLHDRPVCWACQPRHWTTTRLRPTRIPSAATLSRRLDGVAVGLFWRALAERVRGEGPPALVSFVDGKPLLVGGNSKDPDAKFGRAAGHVGKGYKLHTVWGTRPLPEAWEVTPLNGCEKAAARRLVTQLTHGGYLLGDGNYDASTLYDAAWAAGYQLLARCRKAKNPGCGNCYQSPHRRRGLALMESDFGRTLYRGRTQIERNYGNAVGFGGGLTAPPAWVRGLERIHTWTWAKLIINGVRIHRNHDLRQS